MKYVYIMDYWVPFPSSEYGGVLTIIAENDDEVYNLICSEDGIDQGHTDLIMPMIQKAQKLELGNDYKSSIIDAFIT